MKPSFRLHIEKLAAGGYGLGHAEAKAVFVPYTAPGDEVQAELLRERKDVAFARATAFLARGEGVREAPCAAFAARIPCGGCDWLHLEYEKQLQSKTGLVREALQPLAPELVIPETLPSPVTEHYRNKAYLPVGTGPDGLRCGIYAPWSHQIVEHEACLLHPPVFDRIARRCLDLMSKAGVQAYEETTHRGILRHLGLRCNRDQSRILLILVTRGAKLPFSGLLVKQLTREFPQLCGIVQNINRQRGNVILGLEDKLLWGEPWLTDELGGLNFRVHYRSFWQVNSALLEVIISLLRSLVSPGDLVWDVYSGIGSLGLSLAAWAREVLCVEECPEAVADGEFNAQANGIANAAFLCAKAEDALPEVLNAGRDKPGAQPSLLLLDPPRSGLHPDALKAILTTAPERILYLSCSLATLRRDLLLLIQDGRYRITLIQPCDMFPHTWHVETLVQLERVAAN